MKPSIDRTSVWFLPPLLCACAATAPYVHPTVAARPAAETTRLLAATEAPLFPCSIAVVRGDNAVEVKGPYHEVSLPPGRYHVTLRCSSGYHTGLPQVAIEARAGKAYRVTGYFVDDSITIFTMRMRAKAEELASQ